MNKDTLEYLESAIEIETDILRFKQIGGQLSNEIDHRKKKREYFETHNKKELEYEVKQYEQKLDNELVRPILDRKKSNSRKESELKIQQSFDDEKKKVFLGKALLVFVCVFLASTIIMFILGFKDRLTTDETFATTFGIVALGLSLVAAIVYTIISYRYQIFHKRELSESIERAKQTDLHTQNKLEAAYKEKENRLKQFEQEQQEKFKQNILPQIEAKIKQEEFLQSQAEQVAITLEQLYDQRKEFYEVGIVPPDYRYLDCVGVLYQIFVNDLADTMRDAILLYEERVFRGEMIRGIDKINDHLESIEHNIEQMNVMMRFVGVKLCEISAQSGEIIKELGNIADKIDENTVVSEMILGGIALSNAQTEAIRNNTKRISKLSK